MGINNGMVVRQKGRQKKIKYPKNDPRISTKFHRTTLIARPSYLPPMLLTLQELFALPITPRPQLSLPAPEAHAIPTTTGISLANAPPDGEFEQFEEEVGDGDQDEDG